ncbi:MAG: sigma factor [Acidobacteriota bacterium]
MSEIIRRHGHLVYAVAVDMLHSDRGLAEDVFQETFLRLVRWLRGGQPKQVRSLRRLLAIFARRAAIDALRARPHTVELTEVGYEVNLLDCIYAREIMDALPEHMRRVVEATVLAGLSSSEAALALGGTTAESIRQVKFRALRLLRRMQEADEHESRVT